MTQQFLLCALLLVGSFVASAQATATAITPPLPPLLVTYRYWPEHFVQWVGAELPYSMIELYADPDGPQPLYDAVLTDRSTGKRIHYSNQQQQVDTDKLSGDAYLTRMQFTAPDAENVGAIWNLTFTTQDGKPVIWRFIQGSDVTGQGSGVTAMPNVPMPLLMYREQGAVAGQGTALQVGTQVSEADVWTEISHPPYFVAYRGARTVGLDIAVFEPGTMQWKIESAPTALSIGAAWKLSSRDGKHCNIEGLLYNVPDEKFSNCLGDTFCDAINWIQQEADKTKFVTANEQYYLLRDGYKTCWQIADGEGFLNAAIKLWKDW